MQMRTSNSILSFLNAILLMIVFTSCGGGNPADPSKDSTAKAPTTGNRSGANLLAIDDALYSAYAKAADFETLKNVSVIMSYKIASGGVFTLDGWIAKGGSGKFDFSTKPDIIFSKGVKTAVTLAENDYLGNISIDRKAKDNIDKKIKTNPTLTYIILVPLRDASGLKYKILLSDNPNTVSLIDKAIDTEETFNPCPPRTID